MTDGEATAPVVSVVVPTYGRPDRVEELLDTLADQKDLDGSFEVIVVDNGSPDDTTERLRARAARPAPYALRPMRIEVNQGPARARNAGWRAARAPLVAFTDDDCRPDPSWLAAGVAHLAAHPRVGVLQGTTRPPDWPRDLLAEGSVVRLIEGPTPHFEGCNVFYRREALEAGGGFDEDLGWWGEDAAAGWRVIEHGWERSFEPAAVVLHDVEVRDLRWHLRHGLLERQIVGLATRYPGFRDECFWRRWAVRPEEASLALALAGLVAAVWWRPAALAMVPYLVVRPPLKHPKHYGLVARRTLVDLSRVAGHLAGALRHRTFVL